jgi:hypothetical protein
MRGAALFPVLLAGLTPLLVLTLIVTGVGLGWVQWQPPLMWTTHFGTARSDNGVTSIVADKTGIYAGGYVGYYNYTPNYLFLNKYDFNGGLVWTRQLGTPQLSTLNAVSVGAEGVYVGDHLNNTGFVQKYDLNGHILWSDQFGARGGPDVSVGVASAYAVGLGPLVGNGVYSAVLSAYDFNGTMVWTSVLGNSTTLTDFKVHAMSDAVYVTWGGGPHFCRSITWTEPSLGCGSLTALKPTICLMESRTMETGCSLQGC